MALGDFGGYLHGGHAMGINLIADERGVAIVVGPRCGLTP